MPVDEPKATATFEAKRQLARFQTPLALEKLSQSR